MFRGRKIFTMLISLLAAVLLWLYVISTVAKEVPWGVPNIPISIDGTFALEERGLVITQQNVDSLNLQLSTLRANCSKLNAETIRVNADASKIKGTGPQVLPLEVTFPDTVRTSDVDILNMSVSYVTVTVSQLVQKTFPIEFVTTGSPMEGYLIETDSVVLDPFEVEVLGPEEEVGRIAMVVVNCDVSELRESVYEFVPILFLDEAGEELKFSEHTTIRLPDSNFSEAGVPQTRLTLSVYRTKEILLTLNFIESDVLKKENVGSVTMSPSSILVKGPADVIDEMKDEIVLADVDLAEITSGYQELSFRLDLPLYVKNTKEESEIKAVIRLKGITQENIFVSDIRVENAPSGFDYKISPASVKVTIWGSTEKINQIKNDSNNGIYVVVDLSGYNNDGAFSVPGRVVNEAHNDIIVKSDRVEVNVNLSLHVEPNEPDRE